MAGYWEIDNYDYVMAENQIKISKGLNSTQRYKSSMLYISYKYAWRSMSNNNIDKHD
ncbi:hypothetical protein DERF_014199 [Dermatophagoides farinae]|uniref:Uncharacterized protein n=1 Tax=Dermatophagoides farinae TaxID=6954 RepID=A0A922HLM4_DERFA|nr:hypothetical protein DERF_014199 [Dermatophagoides farinae]